MRDAAVLVRAEAGLNHLVSEMASASDGTATLFLEHPRVAVTIDLNRGARGNSAGGADAAYVARPSADARGDRFDRARTKR